NCWSPPRGPDLSNRMSSRHFPSPRLPMSTSATILPVVPVHTRLWHSSSSRFQSAHSTSSGFILSCATSAIVFFLSIRSFAFSRCNENTTALQRRLLFRYDSVTSACRLRFASPLLQGRHAFAQALILASASFFLAYSVSTTF